MQCCCDELDFVWSVLLNSKHRSLSFQESDLPHFVLYMVRDKLLGITHGRGGTTL
jgi:hypothetical protein